MRECVEACGAPSGWRCASRGGVIAAGVIALTLGEWALIEWRRDVMWDGSEWRFGLTMHHCVGSAGVAVMIWAAGVVCASPVAMILGLHTRSLASPPP